MFESPQEAQGTDQTDDLLASPGNFGLSPTQRKGILYKKFKSNCKYQGNPDLLPIRSDEFTYLVRILHMVSVWINTKFSNSLQEAYHRKDFVGSVMRELLTGPSTYLTRHEFSWFFSRIYLSDKIHIKNKWCNFNLPLY